MLDARCWILDAGYYMLVSGCWLLASGGSPPDAEYWMLDAGYSMLDARFLILGIYLLEQIEHSYIFYMLVAFYS